ncbi:MAG: hypothetical protein ACE5J2_06895 [Nitrososphaerales archaeon]
MATLSGKPYYKIISSLKSLGLQFDSVSPEEAARLNSKLVITTKEESSVIEHKNMLLDTELDVEPALIKAKILRSLMSIHQDDQLVIGMDPGKRIGIVAFYLEKEIESQVVTSVQRALDLMTVLVNGTKSRKKIVRIGDGNPAMAKQIANNIYARFKEKVVIEFVNEHGTSALRTMDSDQRGLRDKLSARVIALRNGRRFRPVIPIHN